MGLIDVEFPDLFKKFDYLGDSSRFQIDSVYINEESKVYCVTVNVKIKDLKDLVDTKGWNCIFETSIPDDQSIFTCITHMIT